MICADRRENREGRHVRVYRCPYMGIFHFCDPARGHIHIRRLGFCSGSSALGPLFDRVCRHLVYPVALLTRERTFRKKGGRQGNGIFLYSSAVFCAKMDIRVSLPF